MKGKSDILSLKVGDRIHINNDCKHVWRVNGAPKTYGKRYPNECYVPIKYGLYDSNRLHNEDEFHLVSQCPYTHISSPFTTNRSYYRPPIKIQART